MSEDVLVLGGGPAGLATGWGLTERAIPFRLIEAASTVGGLCRTLRHGEYLFDTGPHRFHDRDPVVTKRVSALLGSDLRSMNVPNRILWEGRSIDFPLRPLQAITSGGIGRTVQALADFARARVTRRDGDFSDFESLARASFGDTVAATFLIPFSQKLWGLPAAQLAPDIAGRRLPGFTVRGLVREVLLRQKPAAHLEGRFLYPRRGYGQIVSAIAQTLPPECLWCGTRVVGLTARDNCIVGVTVQRSDGRQELRTSAVVNTLPITRLAPMLNPPPPDAVLAAARALRFRHVILVALFLDQQSVSEAACLYFPDPAVEFTRAHEPRNRSPDMSPIGKTSLVVEFPCFDEDPVWRRPDAELVGQLVDQLGALELVHRGRIEGSTVLRLPLAYPVYSKDYRGHVGTVLAYLRQFANLLTIGRGGAFSYGSLHDFVAGGFAAAEVVDRHLRVNVPLVQCDGLDDELSVAMA